jgi:hypothetical protein
MTEHEWREATDPQKLLTFLRNAGKASERKLRLFAVACCRRVWSLLTDERSRQAVEVAEKYADGGVAAKELDHALSLALLHAHSLLGRGGPACDAAYAAARCAVVFAADAVGAAQYTAWAIGQKARPVVRLPEQASQAVILRDIYSNPFHPLPPLDPAVLTWNGGAVAQLALAAYNERSMPSGHLDPARLVVLADALEEAGAPAALLEHLRSPGPHVRGCFALDLVLGNE